VSDGHGLAMVALTFPHYRRNDLADILERFGEAIQSCQRKREFRDMLEAYGIEARVRALEATHGENGWHPHVHLLLFTKRRLTTAELAGLQAEWFSMWADACESNGFRRPNEAHGVRVADGTKAAAYVAKWGEEMKNALAPISREMVCSHTKNGRDGGRSPWQLLRDAHGGDRHAGHLFHEFISCFSGRRQLSWSRGGRELLGLQREKTDEELAEEKEHGAKFLVAVPKLAWTRLLNRHLRGELLAIAAAGDAGAVRKWLLELMAEKRPPDPPPPPPREADRRDHAIRARKLSAVVTDREDVLA
jgi:hypothetical protein